MPVELAIRIAVGVHLVEVVDNVVNVERELTGAGEGRLGAEGEEFEILIRELRENFLDTRVGVGQVLGGLIAHVDGELPAVAREGDVLVVVDLRDLVELGSGDDRVAVVDFDSVALVEAVDVVAAISS